VRGQPFSLGPKVHVSYVVIGGLSKTYHLDVMLAKWINVCSKDALVINIYVNTYLTFGGLNK
jgi:hypothetical protein